MSRIASCRLAGWVILPLWLAACGGSNDQTDPGLAAAKGGTTGGPGTPTVDAVDPTEAEQGTTLDVRVFGSGYDQGSTADLLLDGQATSEVVTNHTTFVNQGEVIANITIAEAAVVDRYDVRVTTSRGKKGIGIEKFQVQPKLKGTTPVTVTFADRPGDAVRSDGAGSYSETGSTGIHISGNGNLMFWPRQFGTPTRSVRVTTTVFDGSTTDRFFTNNHTNPGGDNGLGLLGLPPGTTGAAVVEVELNQDDGDPIEVLRYGKSCSDAVVEATKATVSRSLDGTTWIITGGAGVHCKQLRKKPGTTQVGTAAGFRLTLVQSSP
jgi:hypothetical protein